MEPHGNEFAASHHIQTREVGHVNIFGEGLGPTAGCDGYFCRVGINARAASRLRGTCEALVGDDGVFCGTRCWCGGGDRGSEVGERPLEVAVVYVWAVDGGVRGGDEFLVILSAGDEEWFR